MTAVETHQWREVYFFRDARCAPGQLWSVRMLFSVRHDLPTFTDHILAAADGLDEAYYTTWVEAYSDEYHDYVVGLRRAEPGELTDVEAREQHRIADEKLRLEQLMAKYPDVVEATLAAAVAPDPPRAPIPPDLEPGEYGQ